MKTLLRAFVAVAVLSFALIPSLADAAESGKPQQFASPDEVPAGLAKSDWQSIRASYEAGRHAFQPVEGGPARNASRPSASLCEALRAGSDAGGWQARNPGQQWTTKFDGRGFIAQPRGADWQWGLELKSYGFTGHERTIAGTPAVKADGQRLTYDWDATVQEWWKNDTRGLEHGFTIKERPLQLPASAHPPSTIHDQLSFTLAVRGTLKPVITADAQGVEFRDAAGVTVLNYSGLKVWDADGKILASRFEPAGEKSLRLVVDERGARYPLTIDPIAQQAYVKASNTGAGDSFGISVAISGDTVVVGAVGEDSSTTGVNSTPNNSASASGAAYVFVRSGTTWTQQAYLKPAAVGTTQAGDLFGISVAVSGDTVVVGANLEDSSTTGVNSTPNENFDFFDCGAAYVFTRSAGVWTQQAYLKPAAVGTTQMNDQFGFSVAVSGDTVVVGAKFEDSSTTGVNGTPNEGAGAAGAAYVFTRSGTTWTQQAYLKPAAVGTTQANDLFGISVAVSGDTVVVGAEGEASSTTGVNSTPNDDGFANASGAAYVFARSGTTWTQQAYLKPAAVGTTQGADHFGSSVAVSGDTVVVGSPDEDSSTTGVNSTPNEGGTFFDSGAAYVFTRSGTTWTQQAYLKPAAVGSTQANDQFGTSVALSGDTVVVGAVGEDSSTTGVNSTPDESASASGAAYVFTRSGTTWTQNAYLKPAAVSTTQAGDNFGSSVAVSGKTAVVGANLEDSVTTGVNSAPDESAADAGAAYVFATPPTVTGIAPASGPTTGGTTVTITGSDFNAATAVTLGGAAATNVNVVTATSITATTPAHAPGLVDVAVTTTGGSGTGANLFTYALPPTPVFVNPPGGSTAGGTSVTIHGSNFTGATGVSIAGTPVTSFIVISDSRITATTAPHVQTLPAQVTVTTPLVTGTGTSLFTYANLSNTTDTDGDGLNDAAELQLGAFGFDLSSAQPTLVNSFLSGLDLYTPAQIQALNVGTPLIQRDGLGQFKLTIGVEKSTTLAPASFNPFPMSAPQTTINGGKLEFLFTVPDNAAFFQLRAE